MTLSELLRIGDTVTFKVDSEKRYFTNTYDTVPDGTVGVVCGFYDAVLYEPRVPFIGIEPGVYHQKGAVSVWLPDGRIVPGEYSVEMTDSGEERRRDAEMRDDHGHIISKRIRLGDLPETKFWEQDKVLVSLPRGEAVEMTVGKIDYYRMHEKHKDGSPLPLYAVQFPYGAVTSACESSMELIERGNVWNYYHNLPLSFSNLEQEASFFRLIGQAEEVRNPRTGYYSWTKDEVLESIKDGTVHGFTTSHGLFGTGLQVGALRFKNVGLGQRVAQATLEGFEAICK